MVQLDPCYLVWELSTWVCITHFTGFGFCVLFRIMHLKTRSYQLHGFIFFAEGYFYHIYAVDHFIGNGVPVEMLLPIIAIEVIIGVITTCR